MESCSLTPGRAPFPASTRRFFKSRASSFRSGRPRGVSLRGKSRCACNVDPGKGLRYAGKLVRWPTAQAQDARSGKPRCKRSPQLRGHGPFTGFWFFVLFDLIALTARSARCRHLGGDASPRRLLRKAFTLRSRRVSTAGLLWYRRVRSTPIMVEEPIRLWPSSRPPGF